MRQGRFDRMPGQQNHGKRAERPASSRGSQLDTESRGAEHRQERINRKNKSNAKVHCAGNAGEQDSRDTDPGQPKRIIAEDQTALPPKQPPAKESQDQKRRCRLQD